jgi:hypothetical protein
MKNRLYVVCGVLLVAAVGGMLSWSPWAPPMPPEPVYEGKPLNVWLSNEVRLGSPLRLALNDSNPVPFLIQALKRDSWIGARIYRKQVWPELPPPLSKHLPPPSSPNSSRCRINAADWLGRMGPQGRPAVSVLIRALKDDDDAAVRRSAGYALRIAKGDRKALAALVEGLKDKDVNVRIYITIALGYIGDGNQAVATALIKGLEDKDADVRLCSALALGQIGQMDQAVVTALSRASKEDDHSAVRQSADWALKYPGKDSTQARRYFSMLRSEEEFNEAILRRREAIANGQNPPTLLRVSPAKPMPD